jgi:hypothetical protein
VSDHRGEQRGITAELLGRALSLLALDGRLVHPDDLAALVATSARQLGATGVVLYLIDLAQRELVPFIGRTEAPGPVLSVDDPGAGLAYRAERVVHADDGSGQVWVPVQDGTERVGVLALTIDASADDDQGLLAFASVVGEFVISKARYGDSLERTRRRQPLPLAAEMRWGLLPPLSFTSPDATIAGLLEPAYDVAGDTFDYAVVGDTAHLAVFDALGHGLTASRLANLAVSSYRNSRRGDATLEEVYVTLDAIIASEFGDGQFVTASLATVDLRDGAVRYLNVGHPLPLVVRAGGGVDELACPPTFPAGLGGEVRGIGEATIGPGDSLVIYTDGVVEARSPTGEWFGVDRFVEFIVDAFAREEPRAETLRRLMARLLEHHDGQLRDDASVLVFSRP